MDAETVQLMRVAEELLKYLYLEGAREVELRYEFGEARSSCLAEAKDLVLDDESLAELRRALKGPRQPELSEYYGGLVGKRIDASELALASTMAEAELIVSEPEGGTRILVSRRREAGPARGQAPRPARMPWFGRGKPGGRSKG